MLQTASLHSPKAETFIDFPTLTVEVANRRQQTNVSRQLAFYRFLREGPGEIAFSGLPEHIIVIERRDDQFCEMFAGDVLYKDKLKRHQVHIFPSGVDVAGRWEGNPDVFHLHLTQGFVSRVAEECMGISESQAELVTRLDEHDAILAQFCEYLGAPDNIQTFGSEVFMDSMSYSIAIHLIRHHSVYATEHKNTDAAPGKIQRYHGRLNNKLLSKLHNYLQENLANRIDLADLAGQANMSPFHFSRCFKAATKRTPHQYLTTLRIAKAKQLLLFSELPIAAIAEKCGIYDPTHFSALFKRHTRCTPSHFRDTE